MHCLINFIHEMKKTKKPNGNGMKKKKFIRKCHQLEKCDKRDKSMSWMKYHWIIHRIITMRYFKVKFSICTSSSFTLCLFAKILLHCSLSNYYLLWTFYWRLFCIILTWNIFYESIKYFLFISNGGKNVYII